MIQSRSLMEVFVDFLTVTVFPQFGVGVFFLFGGRHPYLGNKPLTAISVPQFNPWLILDPDRLIMLALCICAPVRNAMAGTQKIFVFIARATFSLFPFGPIFKGGSVFLKTAIYAFPVNKHTANVNLPLYSLPLRLRIQLGYDRHFTIIICPPKFFHPSVIRIVIQYVIARIDSIQFRNSRLHQPQILNKTRIKKGIRRATSIPIYVGIASFNIFISMATAPSNQTKKEEHYGWPRY